MNLLVLLTTARSVALVTTEYPTPTPDDIVEAAAQVLGALRGMAQASRDDAWSSDCRSIDQVAARVRSELTPGARESWVLAAHRSPGDEASAAARKYLVRVDLIHTATDYGLRALQHLLARVDDAKGWEDCAHDFDTAAVGFRPGERNAEVIDSLHTAAFVCSAIARGRFDLAEQELADANNVAVTQWRQQCVRLYVEGA